MTFWDDEKAGGAPVEVYKFNDGNTDYLLTSSSSDVLFGGETYTATAISRDVVRGNANGDPTSIEVSVPVTEDLVQDHAFRPSLPVTLELHRIQGANSITFWKGKVSSFEVQGAVCKMRVPSRLSLALSATMPNVIAQRGCNHMLYDAKCTIVATTANDFKLEATVETVSSSGLVIGFAGGLSSGWYTGGEVVRTSTGERRYIRSHLLALPSGSITIGYPFSALNVGDAIDVFAGCDRTPETCENKFDNLTNYGGLPDIPLANVFTNRRGIKGL